LPSTIHAAPALRHHRHRLPPLCLFQSPDRISAHDFEVVTLVLVLCVYDGPPLASSSLIHAFYENGRHVRLFHMSSFLYAYWASVCADCCCLTVESHVLGDATLRLLIDEAPEDMLEVDRKGGLSHGLRANLNELGDIARLVVVLDSAQQNLDGADAVAIAVVAGNGVHESDERRRQIRPFGGYDVSNFRLIWDHSTSEI
jgi:hypothetical protein